MSGYSVRGGGGFGFMPSTNQYGFIAEGNLNDSYGPWIDPELQRAPHKFGRRTMVNRHRGHKKWFNQQY